MSQEIFFLKSSALLPYLRGRIPQERLQACPELIFVSTSHSKSKRKHYDLIHPQSRASLLALRFYYQSLEQRDKSISPRHLETDPKSLYRCYYCRRHFSGKLITLDHFVPLSLGGKDEHTNIRFSCRSCNQTKNNIHPYKQRQLYQVFLNYRRHHLQAKLKCFFEFVIIKNLISKQEQKKMCFYQSPHLSRRALKHLVEKSILTPQEYAKTLIPLSK